MHNRQTLHQFRPFRFNILTLLIGISLLSVMSASVNSADLQVLSSDGARRQQIPALEQNTIVFVSSLDLAHLLSAKYYWSQAKKKMDIKFGGHLLTLTVSNPVVVLDRKAFQMPLETLYRKGTLWIPIKTLCRILEQAAPGWLTWRSDTEQLQLLSPGFNIHDIGIESKENGTLITISTTETFSLEHSLGPSHWLTITVLGGRVDPETFNLSPADKLVTRVKAYQFNESCQISLQLAQTIQTYKVYQEEEPPAIIVLVRPDQGNRYPSKSSTTAPNELKPNKELALFDLIVLDPGHGGKDPGAVGPTGLKEKDVVLDITHRLVDLLRSQLGIEVILTRDDDSYISLQRRTEIANSTGADLFISIHANASRKRSVGGCETFFLSPAKNDEARAVAMLENAALKFEEDFGPTAEGLSDEDFILRDIVSDMLQSSFLKESEDLAASIQADMDSKLDLRNRGVDQAGFFVLVGAKMPSILIEIAFISNQYEEKLLKQRWFRQQIAEAIFNGIKRFKIKYESKL
jgi:N-acetylmuramoyl-L-alanine amidase